jgi:hypothetical protein
MRPTRAASRSKPSRISSIGLCRSYVARIPGSAWPRQRGLLAVSSRLIDAPDGAANENRAEERRRQ